MTSGVTAAERSRTVGMGVKLPTRHLSVRVPWHDSAWNGTVCLHPVGNASCLVLGRIRELRNDTQELANAGRSWDELPPAQLPPCVAERAGFMAPFTLTRTTEHPYAATSRAHTHFAPTPLDYPKYSAACIPFRWMLRGNTESIIGEYGIDFREEIEARARTLMDFETGWVQERRNQLAMLDTFFGAIEPDKSLCFFYAKRTPLAEDSRRVLIGVGRVTAVGKPTEYEYNSQGELRSVLWERPVHHSIRPDGNGGFVDGFLLPYHAILERAKTDLALDPARFVAFAPEESFEEFSYGSEHVSNDSAIAALLVCAEAIRESIGVVPGDWEAALRWIDARLNELWEMRGPFPGLGSVLTAFGVEQGNFLAYDIASIPGWEEDPWSIVESVFEDPAQLGPGWEQRIGPMMRSKWCLLPEERRALLTLLSRFNLTMKQARRFYDEDERETARIAATDAELLANPYLLYELDRHALDAVALGTVDRGVFPDAVVRDAHPLPAPSRVDEPIDSRRVRAVIVSVLERASEDEGHTLLPRNLLVRAIGELPLNPPCQIDADLLRVADEHLAPVVGRIAMADNSPAYQLARLSRAGEIIRSAVNRRLGGRRLEVKADWSQLLADQLPALPAATEEREAEQRAREEKVAALDRLADSRISVLIGPAGTGKTTLLSVLCGHPQVGAGGITLLTPTGKARVQLQQRTGISAQTIAQFLVRLDRYDTATGAYLLDGKPPVSVGETLIIDEASMLTEEQLAATLEAVKGPARVILVGDPRQLPPIGSGRPFVDIVNRLQPDSVEGTFPRVGQGYAELTVRRRQTGSSRDDLLLAEWFSGQDPDPGADEIWSRVEHGATSDTLRFVRWETPQELHDRLIDLIAAELQLRDRDDAAGFEASLGGVQSGDYIYFNRGSAAKVESWQILSPVRGQPHGVGDLNRVVQRHFRRQTLEWANGDARWRKIPKPLGPEEIVYGDKVICTTNQRRRRVYPEADAMQYVANGEIGLAVGQFKRRGMKGTPRTLEVEFSSQPGYAYDFYASDMSEDGTVRLELAYAVTVHKAQGSEFGITFLILPQSGGMLSRELLYTALTRQRARVIVLHQGDLSELKRYASPAYSETARRLTSLFAPPALVEFEDRFLEDRLIHRTAGGELVRSKSEVIIANLLHERGIDYEYESRRAHDGEVRYPDFVIEDAETGLTVYWEHLGLLHKPEYRARWERKLAWYRAQDILTRDENRDGGDGGLLLITRDDERGGIDSAQIRALVDEVFGR